MCCNCHCPHADCVVGVLIMSQADETLLGTTPMCVAQKENTREKTRVLDD